MRTSDNRDDILVAPSLGSCLGVALYDPKLCMGGMLHCLLPSASIDPDRAAANPCTFTDTGMVALFQALLDMGADKRRLQATVAGAAQLLGGNNALAIGERNYVVLRRLLWEEGITVAAEETGGTVARTLFLHLDSGRVTVKSRGEERALA